MKSRELRTVTTAIAENMWLKLVTAAQKYAELWDTLPTVNHQV